MIIVIVIVVVSCPTGLMSREIKDGGSGTEAPVESGGRWGARRKRKLVDFVNSNKQLQIKCCCLSRVVEKELFTRFAPPK